MWPFDSLKAEILGEAGLTSVPTFWAYDFFDSVGVNTHLLHRDSFYGTRFEQMKELLVSAGIHHIRDGAMDQHGGFFAGDEAERYRELGRAGIRVTFLMSPLVSREFVQGFPSRVDPAFEAYELPNEFNTQHKYPWVETLQSWMTAFRGYIKDNPETATYPIVGPSIVDFGANPSRLLGNQEANVDFGNIHKYFQAFNPGTLGYGAKGQPPCDAYRYGSLAYAMCTVAQISGTKPVWCTEMGYGSNAAAGKQVTPAVQAKYIARMLVLNLSAGIRRTYLYQLADYGADGFGSYGLVTADGTEKPAFRELRGMLSDLHDRPPAGLPRKLSTTLSGETADVQEIAFQKSDGSYRLLLWLEKPSYDPKANFGGGSPIDVPSQTVLVSLPPRYKVRRVGTFDDAGYLQARAFSSGASPFSLAVRDNITIVELVRDSPHGTDPTE